MAAVGLLKGSLTAQDYEDAAAADPRIDAIRDKNDCVLKKLNTPKIITTRKNARLQTPFKCSLKMAQALAISQ